MDQNLLNDSVRAQLNNFIQKTWETIDEYQASVTGLQELKNQEEIIPIIEDIISDNMIHIGQLQKALELVSPEVLDKIKEGEQAAEETLGTDLDEVPVEVEEPVVEENLKEAMYTDKVPEYVHIASVGLYSTGCDQAEYGKEAEEGHFEIDMDNKVFTRVKDKGYLGHWMIESYPRDTMKEVEQTANNIMSDGDFKEVTNDEYLQIQDEWEKAK